MLDIDVIDFLHLVRDKKKFVILEKYSFSTETPQPYMGPINNLLIDNESLLLIDSFLFERYKPKFDQSLKKWIFSSYDSPIIEFRIPKILEDNRLLNGRIYSKIGWLQSDEDNKKFKSSYGKLERLIKSRFEKVSGIWWISDNVKKWSLASDGVLAFGGELALSRKLLKSDFQQ